MHDRDVMREVDKVSVYIYVCVCVCVCVCLHACACVYVFVRVDVCVYVNEYVCVEKEACVRVFSHTRTQSRSYTHMNIIQAGTWRRQTNHNRNVLIPLTCAAKSIFLFT